MICALCNGVKYGVDNDVTVNGTNYTYLGGEIVLVDEDLEAYYNGTLVFYDKNNLPQTE